MSDSSNGPGWWEASDGKWYPPELHPDAAQPTPPEYPSTSTIPAAPADPIHYGPTSASVPQPPPEAAPPTTQAPAWPQQTQYVPQTPQFPQYGQYPQQPMQHYGGGPAPLPPKGNRNSAMIFAILGGAMVVGLIGVIGYLLVSDDDGQQADPTVAPAELDATDPDDTSASPSTDDAPEETDPPDTEAPDTEAPTTDEPTTDPPPTQPPGELTDTQQQAADEARSMLEFVPSSRLRLIRILSYGDDYTEEDATIAVDSLGEDWNAQARLEAQGLIDSGGHSRDGLFESLTLDYGSAYTEDEATQAVDSVQADWDAEAVQAAESYLEILDEVSCDFMQQLLTDGEKFTPEQALYGATTAGAC